MCREKLVRRVSDASSEPVPSVASLRHKCACSLLATAKALIGEGGAPAPAPTAEAAEAVDARAAGIVAPFVPALQAAVKAGPYGAGNQARVESEAV